jgi:hypothetical protein
VLEDKAAMKPADHRSRTQQSPLLLLKLLAHNQCCLHPLHMACMHDDGAAALVLEQAAVMRLLTAMRFANLQVMRR